MAFQVVPDTASFRMVSVAGARPEQYINTIYIRNTVLGWPQSRLAAVAATVGNAWRDQIMPLVGGSAVFDRVDARDLGSEFGAVATVEYNTAGTRTGPAGSGMVCALARLEGAAGGLPRRGRLFISPLSETDVDGDTLSVTFRNLLTAGLVAIDSSITGGGDEWVIVSRYANNVLRPQGITNDIASFSTRPIIGAQRDRRPGEGT